MIRCLLLRCGQPPVVEDREPTLAAMQAAVGGWIEHIHLVVDDAGQVILICNEEGKLGGHRANRLLRRLDTGKVWDVLAGDAVIARVNSDGEYASLTDADIARWSEWFAEPLPEDFPVPEPQVAFVFVDDKTKED